MKPITTRIVVLSAAGALIAGPRLAAQGRGGPPPWTTAAADAQRTASVKGDPRLTTESVAKDFRFLWKRTLENPPKQLDGLTQPVLLPNIISYKGFKALAFVGGSSDAVFAIDYDLSRLFWERRLEAGAPALGPSGACSGALTTITRATPLVPSGAGGRGRGGTSPAARGGGTPAAAAAGVPPAAGAAVVGGAPDPRLAAAAGRGAPPPPELENPPVPGSGPGPNAVLGGYAAARGGNANVYAISSGGFLHSLNPQDGTDMAPPIKFLPPGARAIGSILLDSVLYAATTGGCGDAPNGVWAIELANGANTVTNWVTRADVAGDGPAFGSDGTVYVATGGSDASGTSEGNALLALEPKTLDVISAFSAARAPFTTSPIVFSYKGRTLIAAGNADGRVYLVDAAAFATGTQLSPLSSSEPLTSGAGTITGLATIDDASANRWIVASIAGPTRTGTGSSSSGAAVALQLGDQGGVPTLRLAWTSRDLIAPVTPAIAGGVVFALSSGEDRGGGSAAERAQRSKPAVLYALDLPTGKQLWSSGTTITSFAHGVGPSAGDGQVFVVTHDGTLYAFGIPMER